MLKFIATALLAALIGASAEAATLRAGYPVCINEELLHQVYTAGFGGDMDALNWLGSNGCSVTKAGLHATVLGYSNLGTFAHIRAYRGKHAAEVWTVREAIDGATP